MEDQTLSKQQCVPCKGGAPPLTEEEAIAYFDSLQGVLSLIPTSSGSDWQLTQEGKSFVIKEKSCWAKNYQDGADFVRSIVEIAQQEFHHPTTVSFHAIGGLSKNDFIMAEN
tara:strand:+ start:620 stop:955 length:336 start_codon:yes stop_codon:yes gene_type:complete